MTRRRHTLVVSLLTLGLSLTATAQVEVAPGVFRDDGIVAVTDVVFATRTDASGATRDLKLDAAFPSAAEAALPVVLFVHGGAFRGGERAEGHDLCQVLARGGYFAATIDYRVVPDVYPAAPRDVREAVRFLQSHADELGIDPTRMALVGATAGGHLAALVALAEDEHVFAGEDEPLASPLRCAISISGSADLLGPEFSEPARAIIGDWVGDLTTEDGRRTARAASPVSYTSDGDPPLLIVHGREDGLVPVRQARRLVRAAREAGVAVDVALVDGGHHLDVAQYQRILAVFLDVHLGGSARAAVTAARRAADRD